MWRSRCPRASLACSRARLTRAVGSVLSPGRFQDPGATYVSAVNADYYVAMDDLSIIKNGSEIFHDGFDGGGPPPSAPYYIGTGFTGSYFTDAATGGTFIEDAANGRLIMAGRFGSDILDAVPTGQIIHHAATLNTNTQPLNVSTLGLKSDDDFEVVGRFDLSLPEDPGENYGIRLHDGADSNDIIRLEVRRSTDPGNPVQVALTRLDLSANTFTIDETITLSPPARGRSDRSAAEP